MTGPPTQPARTFLTHIQACLFEVRLNQTVDIIQGKQSCHRFPSIFLKQSTEVNILLQGAHESNTKHKLENLQFQLFLYFKVTARDLIAFKRRYLKL